MAKRERGSGCLIPPRPNVTAFWTAQCYDQNGRLIRRSTKVRGELKPDADPKLIESWSNVTAAREFLKKLIKDTDAGFIAVGSDPSQMHYADLRKLYMNDYIEQEKKSLMRNAKTDDAYVSGLKWLDKFFGYEKDGDAGAKVSSITVQRIDAFKAGRKAEGAANGTINRALAALRRMFSLAREKGRLHIVPSIKMLPEPKQPRQGFLEVEDYEKLYNALGIEVKNKATGKTSHPYNYIQPLLQTGFYTGMRLDEIVKLTWGSVDVAENVIRLAAGTTKNDEARIIPMIDGLPEMFETLRRANPKAGKNDRVFLSDHGGHIGSFIKAWRNACIKAGIKTKKNGLEIVSHFDESGKYHGFLFHDLRRSAIRNLIRAGVNQTVAKKISGHKTDAVFERYNITSTEDLQDAAAKMSGYLKERRASAKPSQTS